MICYAEGCRKYQAWSSMIDMSSRSTRMDETGMREITKDMMGRVRLSGRVSLLTALITTTTEENNGQSLLRIHRCLVQKIRSKKSRGRSSSLQVKSLRTFLRTR
jgi:hypothetical protein